MCGIAGIARDTPGGVSIEPLARMTASVAIVLAVLNTRH